jgi:hypothetical protein
MLSEPRLPRILRVTQSPHPAPQLCRRLTPSLPLLLFSDTNPATGEYIKTLGLDFDATGLLGNHRSKRFAAVVENGEVKSLFVESEAPEITVTKAETVLGGL